MNNYIAFDTEFFNSNEKEMKVVCAVLINSLRTIRFNLLDEHQLQDFKEYLVDTKNIVFVTYAAAAEARSLLSLGINPLKYKWIDLYVEFRMLCNSNDKYNYGEYLNKEGIKEFSYAPKYEDQEDGINHTETPKNLVNALYKLLNVEIDVDQKTDMRDLILSKDLTYITKRMDEILDYCESDTKYLLALKEKFDRVYKTLGLSNYETDQFERGRYSVSTAIIENRGLPINHTLLDRVIEKTPIILETKKSDVNQTMPGFFVPAKQKEPKILKNGKKFVYKPEEPRKDTKVYQDHVTALNIKDFPRTETGKFKSDAKTLEKYGYWGGLEKLWQYNKLESSLKWFNNKNGDGFFEHVGSDGRVRPYYGIFGTQTGRNAARAKTFPLAMSSWLRAIIQPPKGKVIVGSDFSQQEVYVAAILSKDQRLLDAYNSGDVYLEFGKMTGSIPKDGNKTTHKFMRNLFKSTVLGKQFGMGIDKLWEKLKLDSKDTTLARTVAEEMDRYHKETFREYWKYVYSISGQYQARQPLITTDGWVLWCDNPVLTSVRNFPVQGNSASITRLAVNMLIEQGYEVLCSLHDAVYVECDEKDSKEVTLAVESIMKIATAKILNQKLSDCTMRIDTKIITNDKVWIEEKGQSDWELISPLLK